MAAQAAVDPALEGVAHDLSNVFQTIEDAARLLSADPKWNSISAILGRSVERGRRITRSLEQNSATPADVEQAVASAVDFAGDVLRALHIPEVEITREVEPGLRLRGAACDWARVLLNLLVNAGEAVRHGGIVEVCARRSGNQIEIKVSDNGPGIPEALLPLVFRPNFSARHRGSGMGLHIVDSLVRKNGGLVSASNRPDGGAEFRIVVPV